MTRLSLPVFFDDSDAVAIKEAWYVVPSTMGGFLLLNNEWRIRQRISNRKVECANHANGLCKILILEGPLDAAEMSLAGFDVAAIAAFSGGIPENWQSYCSAKEEEVVAVEEKRRRSSRKAAVEQPCLDEDALLLQALRKSESKPTPGCFSAEMIKPSKPKPWTKEEKSALHLALLTVPSNASDFWEQCASQHVRTKTAQECETRWAEEIASAAAGGRANGGVPTTSCVSEADAMQRSEKIGKLGTAKFRQQVRREWEATNLKRAQPSCAPLSTPFRSNATRMRLADNSELRNIATPVNTFCFGDAATAVVAQTPLGSESTPNRLCLEDVVESPDILVRVNRDNLDDYLVALLKQNGTAAAAAAKKSNRKPARRSKPVPKPELEPCTPLSRHGQQQRRCGGGGNVLVATTIEEAGVAATITPGGSVHLKIDPTKHAEQDSPVPEQSEEEEDWM